MSLLKRFRNAFTYRRDLENLCAASAGSIPRNGVAMYKESWLFEKVRDLGDFWYRQGGQQRAQEAAQAVSRKADDLYQAGRLQAAVVGDTLEQMTSGRSSYSMPARATAGAVLVAGALMFAASVPSYAAAPARRAAPAAQSGGASAGPASRQAAPAPRPAARVPTAERGGVCSTCAPHPEDGVIPVFYVKGVAKDAPAGSEAKRYKVQLPPSESCVADCIQMPTFLRGIEVETPKLTRKQRARGLQYRLRGADDAVRLPNGNYLVNAGPTDGKGMRLVLELYHPDRTAADCGKVAAAVPFCPKVETPPPTPVTTAPPCPPCDPATPAAPPATPEKPSKKQRAPGVPYERPKGELTISAGSGEVANHLAIQGPGGWTSLGIGNPWKFSDTSLGYRHNGDHANVAVELGVATLQTPGTLDQGIVYPREGVRTQHGSAHVYASNRKKGVGPLVRAGASSYRTTFDSARGDAQSGSTAVVGAGLKVGTMQNMVGATYDAVGMRTEGTGPLPGEVTGTGYSLFAKGTWGDRLPGSIEARWSAMTPHSQDFAAPNLRMESSTTGYLRVAQNVMPRGGIYAELRTGSTQFQVQDRRGPAFDRRVVAEEFRVSVGLRYTFGGGARKR